MTKFNGRGDTSFVTTGANPAYIELFFVSIFAQDKAFEFSGRREYGLIAVNILIFHDDVTQHVGTHKIF